MEEPLLNKKTQKQRLRFYLKADDEIKYMKTIKKLMYCVSQGNSFGNMLATRVKIYMWT